MPSERRRIRDRIYQRKRRLNYQVRMGKITPAEMATTLATYRAKQSAQSEPHSP